VTALLLAAPLAEANTSIVIEGLIGSRGYLDLTLDTMRAFGATVETDGDTFHVDNSGYGGTAYEVEPDASAAVYPMLAAAMTGGRVAIEGLGLHSKQPDYAIIRCLEAMGCRVEASEDTTTITGPTDYLNPIDVDLSGSPDGALAVAVGCVRGSGPSRIRGLESLRYKESDRLLALATEINRVGGSATIEDSTLSIIPGSVRPTDVETYADHRVAMSFALLGLVAPGIRIQHPEVVNKTWPGFWEMLESL
jgi:3-phosphoshikimate 1-carboxyvinyltransferase